MTATSDLMIGGPRAGVQRANHLTDRISEWKRELPSVPLEAATRGDAVQQGLQTGLGRLGQRLVCRRL